MPRSLILLCLLVSALAAPASSQPAPVTIPPLRGTTFSGLPVSLPADLSGRAGVLVLGFSEASRDAVTLWGKRLATDYYSSPTVLYYELPVLASVPRMLRGLVESRIRSSVSDRGKVHFVPVTEDEAGWRSAALYSAASPDAAYVLLVDGHGQVRWQASGPPSDQTYRALQQHLEELQPK